MGGRLDSTNVVQPMVSVITTIDLDHMDTLGNTLIKIASEKAGIIKESTPVVIGKQRPNIAAYLEAMALKHNAQTYRFGYEFFADAQTIRAGSMVFSDIHCDMPGAHQRINAATAAMAIEVANIPVTHSKVRSQIETTQLSGRIEKLSIAGKTVIIDAGHTLQSVKMLFETLHALYPNRRYLSVVTYSIGKRIKEMLSLEERYGMTTILTGNASFRSESVEKMLLYCTPHRVIDDFKKAIYYALDTAESDDIVVIHGTFLMMPIVYEHLQNYGL
jgi:dihydrofolate synthase/folylpolyglutamate synthase